MKILFVIHALKIGGMERRMIELLKGLILYPQIKIHLLILSKIVEYEEVFGLNFSIDFIERKGKKDISLFAKVYSFTKKINPDIIHSWGALAAVYMIIPKLFLKKILINGCIVDAPESMRWFDKRLFETKISFLFSDIILSNSKAGIKAFNAPKKKTLCIYNGIDTQRISFLKEIALIKKELNIPSNAIVVGMVGAFHVRKDYITFIKAAELLLNKNNNIVFLGIGDGPNLEKIKNLIKVEHKDRIILPGRKNDVENIVNVFDIGVLSTNVSYHGEGISNAIIEYMLLGKPVVATDSGGTPEIIENNKTGFLVPPFSEVAMADRILWLIENEQERKKMGEESKKKILNEFSLETMVKKYLFMYKKFINYDF